MVNDIEKKDYEQLLKESNNTIKQAKLIIQVNEQLVTLAETKIWEMNNMVEDVQ